MGKYQGYDKYKDSGVEWLGAIPEHWEVKKFSWIAPIITCGLASTPEYIDESEGIPFLSAQNVKNHQLIFDKYNFISQELHQNLTRYKKPERGDILVTRVGACIGDACIIETDLEFSIYVSLTHIRVNSNLVVNKYIVYFFESEYCKFLNLKGTIKGGGVGNLNVKNVQKYMIPIPPLDEQEKIARFLDYKTKQIDDLIAKKETLIEKLDEKRTALISHAVTKGLDVNVSMKDSGIEWLGDIPKHWQQKRFKFAVYLINNKIEAEDSNLPYMGLEHIESWTGKRIEDENASSEGIGSHFLPDDVLFGKLRPYLAKVYLSEIEGLASTEALVLRSKKYINPKYLKYYILSREFINIVNSSTFGAKMPRASWDFIGNLFLLIPPLHEQQKIAEYLDQKTAEIEEQKTKIQQAIDLLKEYRTALITNAVTGKIDVRKITIPKI